LRNIFFIAFTFLITFPVVAQQTKTYSFTHYTTSSGLLSDQVFGTVQDEDGFLWIAGTDGLQRFDGSRFKSFLHNSNDPNSIPVNGIYQLLMDKNKRLWLYLTDGSVGIFNTKTFVFTRMALKPKNKSSLTTPFKFLTRDESGNIFFVLVGRELLMWNSAEQSLTYEHLFINLRPEWAVSDVAQQPGTQKYWIGLMGKGIAIYNKATGNMSYPGHNIENEPAIDAYDKSIHPNHMLFDKKGRLWFFCWTPGIPEIFCYNTITHTAEKYELISSLKQYHEVNGFMEQSDGSIWVMGLKVFAKFLETEKKFQLVYNGYTNETSISYELVISLFEDRERNMWVCSNNNGLYRFNPSHDIFNNIVHTNRLSGKIGSGNPMSFIKTKWGTILNGTWEDGLYHYDSNFNPIPTNIKGLDDKGGPFVWSMFASADSNTIWMSAQPGLYAIDQQKRSAAFYNPPALENRTIARMVEDKNGDLWLGMFRTGVFKWKQVKGKKPDDKLLKRYTLIPDDQAISKLIIDKQHLIWIATDKKGTYVIDPDTDSLVYHFDKDASGPLRLPEDGCSSILEYNDSIMIITTSRSIFAFNRVTKSSFMIGSPDILSGFITDINRDSNGYIWLTTSSGLYRINMARNVFVRFTRKDGIQFENFVPGSSYLMPDGRLIFGTSGQFILFNPTAIHNNTNTIPEVFITDFEVMNKYLQVDSLLKLKEINLNYQQNSITLSFSTLTYSSDYLIKYKVDGLDKEWKLADKNLQATYAYIPPGSYTLLFKVIDEDGNEINSALQLKIKINAPFWKTWWFYSILVLITGSLLFLIDKERMKRKKAIQQMRSNIAGNLHQDVNTALNNINILSEMARLKADAEPEKSKEFIEQIHSKSHNMIIAMDDMLWSISPENDSMQKTVERMQEYIDALNNRYNVQFEMLVDESVKSLNLDMQFRHEAFLLFKESIHGLRQACAGNCKIHVTLQKPHLVYTIQFNNEKCDMQQLNNLLQRQDMAKRLKMIKAKLNVTVHKTNSVFELIVPVM
jgi:ligand-binding sensor domain-containing protein/signal transduction histidine kinase